MAKPTNTVLTFGELGPRVEVYYDTEPMALVEALDRAVADCATHLQRFAGKAKLDVKVSFETKDGRVHLTASVETKLSKPESLPMAAYLDASGRLVEEDPRQMPLDFGPRDTAQAGG